MSKSIALVTATEFVNLSAAEQSAYVAAHGSKFAETATPSKAVPKSESADIFEDSANEEEEPEFDSGVWANVLVELPNGKRMRLTGVSLDNTFIRYNDKEHTKPNQVTESIVKTVDTHGIEAANKGIKFVVELTKAGEAAMSEPVDLLAGLTEATE